MGQAKDKFVELYSLNVNDYVEKNKGCHTLHGRMRGRNLKKYIHRLHMNQKRRIGRCYFGDADVGYMVYTSVTAEELTLRDVAARYG